MPHLAEVEKNPVKHSSSVASEFASEDLGWVFPNRFAVIHGPTVLFRTHQLNMALHAAAGFGDGAEVYECQLIGRVTGEPGGVLPPARDLPGQGVYDDGDDA